MGERRGKPRSLLCILEDVNSLDLNVSTPRRSVVLLYYSSISYPRFPGRRMKESSKRESKYKGMRPGHTTSGLREDEDRVEGERCRRAPPPKAERTSLAGSDQRNQTLTSLEPATLSVPRITRTKAGSQKTARTRRKCSRVSYSSGSPESSRPRSLEFGRAGWSKSGSRLSVNGPTLGIGPYRSYLSPAP